jgi:hypothetical protein
LSHPELRRLDAIGSHLVHVRQAGSNERSSGK